MATQAKLSDYGISVGTLPSGPLGKISDVPGVTVGHCTVDTQTQKTGVTVVMPCADDMFAQKLPAAACVLNGFGKTAGLVQIGELGTLETSVNPVVAECNDGGLNDIARRAVRQEHVFAAIENARADFEEGDVGAGKGMVCHGLKGGIGSASRIVELDGARYTLGVLALANHGRLEDLCIGGKSVGAKIAAHLESAPEQQQDKGSCIVVMATDLPLCARQLERVVKRASVGLARLGSYIGHGSGEVFLGFSTTNRVPHESARAVLPCTVLHEGRIDAVFRAMGEATEEAVLRAMLCADTVTGFDGSTKYTIRNFISQIY
jgi:D-aminopeptidase